MTNRNSGNENESAKARYKNSLERLETIFRGMSDTVQNVSQWRCPYKNVENLCTAKFGLSLIHIYETTRPRLI